MERYLMDSNVIIDYLAGSFISESGLFMDSVINVNPLTSVICKIEVLGFNMPDDALKILKDFFEYSTLLTLSSSVVEKTIEIRKKHRIKTPDAIIAATAIVNDLCLLTRNESDFKNIEELKLLNPWLL